MTNLTAAYERAERAQRKLLAARDNPEVFDYDRAARECGRAMDELRNERAAALGIREVR